MAECLQTTLTEWVNNPTDRMSQTECHRQNVAWPKNIYKIYLHGWTNSNSLYIDSNKSYISFMYVVLFRFDDKKSNLKRAQISRVYWNTLVLRFLNKEHVFISFIYWAYIYTLQIFWLLTLKANYYLFMVVNLLGLNLNRGCCDLVDRKIINLGAKCLEFISKQVLLKVF